MMNAGRRAVGRTRCSYSAGSGIATEPSVYAVTWIAWRLTRTETRMCLVVRIIPSRDLIGTSGVESRR
ncbi:hypothetical protein DPMN_049399 [Dreissena polymorpha]|uniref:Uncharacterized protein n=1 Tax=Dreissena polymorpha TaxID=45954 RepID=A0A9D4CFM6_DREPO|nr:hypothetical protein DPMN_049399 [Dreissena polymorpha]